jgi:enoyl-CoA hydratase
MPANLDVTIDTEHACAWVTLDRPEKRNALSVALRDEITATLATLAADESVKSTVITGAGAVFSAGFDLSEFDTAAADPEFNRLLWESSDRYHHALLTFPLPLIAAVNGPALAGGFDLAICCDVRVASTAARFAHPEFAFAEVVYAPLHDLVGGAVARELCLTGRSLDAREALELRVVNHVVEPDRLRARVTEMATAISVAPRERLMTTKAKALARAGIALGPTLAL